MNLIVGLGTHEQSGVSDVVPEENKATRIILTNLFKEGSRSGKQERTLLRVISNRSHLRSR